jgi:DNA-binding PadR family transcriptional regulator
MTLQYALLGLLSYHDQTGYDLKKLFDDSIRNFWYASMSQIYRELNALEKKGYVTSTIQPQADRPDRRIYSITEAGRTAFARWIREFPEKLSKEKRDEFSLRLFFGASIGNAELTSQFKRLMEQKNKELSVIRRFMDMTTEYAQKLSLYGGEELYWRLILRRAEMNLNTTISWAAECIDLLEAEN